MQRFVILVRILAFFGYRYLPPLTERDVLVLVETKGMYVEKLPKVEGLKSAFRVLRNFDDFILKDDKKAEIEGRVGIIFIFKNLIFSCWR